MCKNDSDFPPPVFEDRSDEPTIQVVSALDDESLLEALMGANPKEKGPIFSFVAEKIGQLGIHNGTEMVMPMAALLQRNLLGQFQKSTLSGPETSTKKGFERNGLGEKLIDGQTELLAVTKVGIATSDSLTRASKIIQAGICLGDRALHAAGIVESTSFSYAESMACQGYNAALEAAKRAPMHKSSTSVILTVPPLIHRFRDAVRIVYALVKQEKTLDSSTQN